MSRDQKSIPEESVDVVIPTQQSYYEHIQLMAATFLSIMIGGIAALGGLISAGVITPSSPTIPEITESIKYSPPIFTNQVTIIYPIDLIEYLINNSVSGSLFYLFAGIIAISSSVFLFISCLNVKPIDPEKHVREKNFINLEKNRNFAWLKNRWINNNRKLLQETEYKFNYGKYNILFGSILLARSGVAILYSAESDIISLTIMHMITSLLLFLFIILSCFKIKLFIQSNHDVNTLQYKRYINSYHPITAKFIGKYRKLYFNPLLDGRLIYYLFTYSLLLLFLSASVYIDIVMLSETINSIRLELMLF